MQGETSKQTDSNEAYAENTPLTAAFGDGARTKIIAALISEQNRDLNVSDIANLAGVARSTVYDHINALQELNIITKTREIGGSPMYEINTDSELVEHIQMVEGLAGRELLNDEPVTA
jgi:DNA-binding transcriptional ArsR family regulator